MYKLWVKDADGSFVFNGSFDSETMAFEEAPRLELSEYRVELTSDTGTSIIFES